MSEQIVCPHCGQQFELSSAMRHQLEVELRSQLHDETERQKAEAREQGRRDVDAELASRDQKLGLLQQQVSKAVATEREALEKLQRATIEHDEKIAAERKDATQLAEDRLRREADRKIHDKDEEIADFKRSLDEAAAKELELRRKERETSDKLRRADIELEEKLAEATRKLRREADDERTRAALDAEQRLAADAKRIRDEAMRTAEERLQRELGDFAKERDAKAIEINGLLRRKQELEDETLRLKTEAERQMLMETDKIREQMRREAREHVDVEQDKFRLREQEHTQQLEGLQRTIEELRQKVTQGSQQLQGEAQEVILKEVLANTFRWDIVADVEKGVQGADLLQTVHDEDGSTCGTIIWESKRTRHWSDDWLAKLKDDQREKSAACAVLVTQAMPADLKRFGMKDGIWVCEWPYAGPLAAALRVGIIQTARARRSEEGRGEKIKLLYAYLTGDGFRQRVKGVVDALVDMQADLNQERNAIIKLWRKRDTQILRAQENLASLWGHLQGIAAKQFTDIEQLMLPDASPRALTNGEGDTDESTDVEGGDGESEGDQTVLVELLFSLLPEDGTNIGNKTLFERFETEGMKVHAVHPTQPQYDRCKEVLKAEGRVRLGKGRGGSVARVVEAARDSEGTQG